jgi:squalene synthase HpnD
MSSATVPAATDSASATSRASGSSFYTAMRILPRAQREAMFEIYSFCRAVDDVADSDAPHRQRLDELAQWRLKIDALYFGRPPANLRALAGAVRAFDLRKDDFLAIIDGMEMDAAADIRAPDWTKLDRYCDRVASAVGRLSVRVFGLGEQEGVALAHHLGRALQLTNILRDLDEDAGMGRLYLPRETLQAAGITDTDPNAVLAHPALPQVCAAVAERAFVHFADADKIMAGCSRRAVRAPRMLQKVYRAILEGLVTRGWSAPRSRIRVSRARLLWIVLQHAIV